MDEEKIKKLKEKIDKEIEKRKENPLVYEMEKYVDGRVENKLNLLKNQVQSNFQEVLENVLKEVAEQGVKREDIKEIVGEIINEIKKIKIKAPEPKVIVKEQEGGLKDVEVKGFAGFVKDLFDILKGFFKNVFSVKVENPVKLDEKDEIIKAIKGYPTKITLKNQKGDDINPATEETLLEIIRAIRSGGRGFGSITNTTPSTTPIVYNLLLEDADTEYSQALPPHTKKFFFQCRTDSPIRYAFESGKVATPTEPYMTLKEGCAVGEEGLDLVDTTVYFASPVPGSEVEIIAWT